MGSLLLDGSLKFSPSAKNVVVREKQQCGESVQGKYSFSGYVFHKLHQ